MQNPLDTVMALLWVSLDWHRNCLLKLYRAPDTPVGCEPGSHPGPAPDRFCPCSLAIPVAATAGDRPGDCAHALHSPGVPCRPRATGEALLAVESPLSASSRIWKS